MKPSVKQITRRELFQEMVSKKTMKQVLTAWYGFSSPLVEEPVVQKKDSLLETVRKANMKYLRKNGKEG